MNKTYEYKTLITKIDELLDEDLFEVKTSNHHLKKLFAHKICFTLDPDLLKGKAVSLITDNKHMIIEILLPDCQKAYHYNSEDIRLYDATANVTYEVEAWQKDPHITKRVAAKIARQQKQEDKAERIENDIKKQIQYDTVKFKIDESLRSMFKIDRMPDYYSINDMAALAFAKEYQTLTKRIPHLHGYLETRKYETESATEMALYRAYLRFLAIRKNIERPLDYDMFLKRLLYVIKGGEFTL